jgi:nitroimidazol reductase NimA-like FMN-containing flavoprotein (pyridoxamine 5'-phosphate oxidase superfamily)
MIYSLSAEDARNVLDNGVTGRLGCIVDDEPYVVPVNVIVDGDFVYFRSLPGRKVDGMRESPRVCLQFDEIESEYRWRSVQVFGDAEVLEDPAELDRVFEMFFARFPHLTPADAVRRFGESGGPDLAIRIRINRITGVGEGDER